MPKYFYKFISAIFLTLVFLLSFVPPALASVTVSNCKLNPPNPNSNQQATYTLTMSSTGSFEKYDLIVRKNASVILQLPITLLPATVFERQIGPFEAGKYNVSINNLPSGEICPISFTVAPVTGTSNTNPINFSPVGSILDNKELIPNFKFGGATSFGNVFSAATQIIFYIALFTALYWVSWGIFEYLFAGGAKEKLAGARKRITWAIVGLIFVLLAYLIAQYAAQIILPAGSNQPASTLPIFPRGSAAP